MIDTFELLSRFMKTHAGIVLKEHQKYQVDNKITPVMEAAKCRTVYDLIKTAERDRSVLLELVSLFTINETSFFRDVKVFQTLQTDIMPDLIAQREIQKGINILSAASSSGQEGYSLAMMMRDAFPKIHDWRVNIVGVDIDPNMVAKARDGWYSQLEVNRGLATRLLLKHFIRENRGYRVKPYLKDWVSFGQGNLFQLSSDIRSYSLICLRNVLIYFSQDDQEKLLRILHKKMRPNGVLLLGSSEIGRQVPSECFTRMQKGNVIWYQAINLV